MPFLTFWQAQYSKQDDTRMKQAKPIIAVPVKMCLFVLFIFQIFQNSTKKTILTSAWDHDSKCTVLNITRG